MTANTRTVASRPVPHTSRITTRIATVSLSRLLAEKLDTIAGAGFDGVEIDDRALVAEPAAAR